MARRSPAGPRTGPTRGASGPGRSSQPTVSTSSEASRARRSQAPPSPNTPRRSVRPARAFSRAFGRGVSCPLEACLRAAGAVLVATRFRAPGAPEVAAVLRVGGRADHGRGCRRQPPGGGLPDRRSARRPSTEWPLRGWRTSDGRSGAARSEAGWSCATPAAAACGSERNGSIRRRARPEFASRSCRPHRPSATRWRVRRRAEGSGLDAVAGAGHVPPRWRSSR